MQVLHEMSTSAIPLRRIRPRLGWAALDFGELWRFRDLLVVLAGRDVKLRYRQTALGVAWVLFQPLFAAGIFTVVFGLIAGLRSEHVPYFVFAYAGVMGWTAFSATLTKVSSSIVTNSHLVSKIYFPRLILPFSTVASVLIDFAVAMTVMAVLLAAYRIAPGAALLMLPLWVATILVLALGAGLIAAALMVRYRDVQHVLPVLVPLLMYGTPVAYSYGDAMAALPEPLRPLLFLNPLSAPLEGLRAALLGTVAPSPASAAYAMTVAVVVFAAGAVVFRNMERAFADVI